MMRTTTILAEEASSVKTADNMEDINFGMVGWEGAVSDGWHIQLTVQRCDCFAKCF